MLHATCDILKHKISEACNVSFPIIIYPNSLELQKHRHIGAFTERITGDGYFGHAKCIPSCRLRGGHHRYSYHWNHLHVLHTQFVGRTL